MRRGPACAALVEQHDAVVIGIVEAAHLRAAAGPWAAVQQHDRLAVRVATLFEIQPVAAIDLQRAGVERFDVGVQGGHASLQSG